MSDLNELDFSQQFFFLENPQISDFMKIRQMGAKLFHVDRGTDGRTDRHGEAYSNFRNFAYAPKRSGRGKINRVVGKVIFYRHFNGAWSWLVTQGETCRTI